jgi:hypothetical protein
MGTDSQRFGDLPELRIAGPNLGAQSSEAGGNQMGAGQADPFRGEAPQRMLQAGAMTSFAPVKPRWRSEDQQADMRRS